MINKILIIIILIIVIIIKNYSQIFNLLNKYSILENRYISLKHIVKKINDNVFLNKFFDVTYDDWYLNNFDNLINPYLVEEISTENSDNLNKSININREYKNEYTLINKDREEVLEYLKNNPLDTKAMKYIIDKIIDHIHYDNEKIDKNDLYPFDKYDNVFFPNFHTDIEYSELCENSGFNIWILLKEDSEVNPRGKMFIMETDCVEPGNILKFMKKGDKNIIHRKKSGGSFSDPLIKEYNDLSELKPKIRYLNAKPVLIDIDEDSWCIDPSLVEAAVTKKTKAIMAVHLYGNLCDMDSLKQISNENDLFSSFGKKTRKSILEWVVVIVGAVGLALLIKAFLFQAYYIPSPSMNPTLFEGDRILVNKLSYKLHSVNRGDLIVFDTPEASGEDDLIKRVIGLPGEFVNVEEERIEIDGGLLLEPYLPLSSNIKSFATPVNCVNRPNENYGCRIPDDHVFVMGDNRSNSRDSRFFGPVPIEDVTNLVN